jgi:flagellar motor switch protein FliN/FliY
MATDLIPHPRALSDGLASQLATMLAALCGAPATASAAPDGGEVAWVAHLRLAGAATGEMSLGVGRADAARISQIVSGASPEATEETQEQALRELFGQVVSGLAGQPIASGLRLEAGETGRISGTPRGERVNYQVRCTPELSPVIAVWSHVERASDAVAQPPAGGRPAEAPEARAQALPANLDVILDIELPLSVRFGEAEMTLDELTKLGPGSVIDLGRSPDDPVDILVNGRLVARGDVVVVSGNYGVRVVEVVSASDRVRSLRA